ncbi:Hsp70 nucleotide exchange factor FES1 like protein [Verticillium longisporum]|uniref:Hsp70 nucleotide exchange factor FES1 like protein n=1 Tax=Verticillium longisporum TaxID=100787 RepID=A0A8I2ZCI6_VERLO|nr:Hsp70 nucleotide exchange factor FES1 like protein [Verticillium longisporum]KAG7127720.1 Hsp70 nucleotide exchange factor FES1 like protein [Verticillium longisporum]
MGDRNLNDLLKWSIANQDVPEGAEAPPGEAPRLNPEAMAALFGGPSDADLMKDSMAAIHSADVPLDQKLIAFDNFEQLIESLDNANNISALSLWTPLLDCLAHEEAEIRRMAAWCVGTAVQNNAPSQERLLAMGGVPSLVALATKEGEQEVVRRKAIYALSSAVRNYQPAMDACTAELAKQGGSPDKVDADNMDAVDVIMEDLKAKAKA